MKKVFTFFSFLFLHTAWLFAQDPTADINGSVGPDQGEVNITEFTFSAQSFTPYKCNAAQTVTLELSNPQGFTRQIPMQRGGICITLLGASCYEMSFRLDKVGSWYGRYRFTTCEGEMFSPTFEIKVTGEEKPPCPSSAKFSYASERYTNFCDVDKTVIRVAPIRPILALGATEGVFTVSPQTGLRIDSNTGDLFTLDATPGTYTITNTVAKEGCPTVSHQTTVTIFCNAPLCPKAAVFDYPQNTYKNAIGCEIDLPPLNIIKPNILPGGVIGTFAATPEGLNIDPTDGSFNTSTAKAGVYTVTNTVSKAGCPVVKQTFTLTIQNCGDGCPKSAIFSYPQSIYKNTTGCAFLVAPAPNVVRPIITSNITLGSFTATPTGLGLATDGSFDANNAKEGTYTITHTRSKAGCPNATATFTIKIENCGALPTNVATFSYPKTMYCQGEANPKPVFTGGAKAGVFSVVGVATGLRFKDFRTGEIDLKTSKAGTYTITNTINGSPTYSFSFKLTIQGTTTLPSPSNFVLIKTSACDYAFSINPIAGATRYVWVLGYGNTSKTINTTTPTLSFSPGVAGNVIISVRGQSACGSSALLQLTRNLACSTGLANGRLGMVETEDRQVRIFPNPSQNADVSLDLQDFMGETKIETYTWQGQLLHSLHAEAPSLVKLPSSRWVAGQYLVRVENDGKIQVKKLIVE